ncbi:MAG: S-adenosylmethionine:tRNA ribosyltransferase-isomerase [Actinomycetota bacterium]|nr:S-adenosylmethionine:tRNA ribosyltransferase-isomerase [Actinomycetota bacterium]
MSALPAEPRTRFQLPPELSAAEPPESRGLSRDGVRLLAATPTRVRHAHFGDITRYLDPGDLLVLNTSATLPAAIDAVRPSGALVVVHFSTHVAADYWVVELRTTDSAQDGPVRDGTPGEQLTLVGGATLTLIGAFPDADARDDSRLWRARLDRDVGAHLALYGRPIRYGYVRERWPLEAYQTVFATQPGSAEMPSAGRPFTPEVLTRLVARGVVVAPVLLHTGVSSQEAHEPPYEEWYRVPEHTARLVEFARSAERRVVAVGTTVVRALETVAASDGTVEAREGWTDLVLGPDRPARVVTGLLTGLHAPGASHLHLLEAVAGPELVQQVYDAALRRRYRWHEFGDVCLLLP